MTTLPDHPAAAQVAHASMAEAYRMAHRANVKYKKSVQYWRERCETAETILDDKYQEGLDLGYEAGYDAAIKANQDYEDWLGIY